MKMEMTPEEHARLHRRRGRQARGLLIAVLVLIGTLTVLHAGVSAVAKLFDDTAQRQEYEDKLEGLVLFDPVPFAGIENIDATILCQRPKLAPHIPAMRAKLAEAFGMPVDAVSVNATTEEHLGYTGEGLGIAAHAVALIEAV